MSVHDRIATAASRRRSQNPHGNPVVQPVAGTHNPKVRADRLTDGLPAL
jgi:hypothetical protein